LMVRNGHREYESGTNKAIIYKNKNKLLNITE
jgi:hypothetical protein